MLTLLEKNEVFENICCPEVGDIEERLDEDKDDEDPSEYETHTIVESQIKEVCTDDPSEVSKDVKLLSDNGLIDATVKDFKSIKVVFSNGQHQLLFQCSPVWKVMQNPSPRSILHTSRLNLEVK